MRRSFVFFLWLFLIIFVLASLYVSFNAYLMDRDRKILANMGTFFLEVERGKERIELPYPEYSVIVYMKKPDKKFMSANVLSDIDRSKYLSMSVPKGKDIVYLYVRKVDLLDYLGFVGQVPLYTGLLVASLLLYLSIFYFTVREFELSQRGSVTEDLLNRLKAFRLTLATFRVIPEESVDEMKKIVDSILKKR